MQSFSERSRAVIVFGVALLVLGLAACHAAPSNDGIAGTTPSPANTPATTSPALETSSGPVEPTPPPELEGDDAAAAEAFVRYFYDWVNYAQATGDVQGLRSLAFDTCGTCAAGLEWIKSIYDRGGAIRGGEVRVVRSKVTGFRSIGDEGNLWYLDVAFVSDKQTVSGAGDLNATFDGGRVNLRFRVVRDSKAWHVDAWSVTS